METAGASGSCSFRRVPGILLRTVMLQIVHLMFRNVSNLLSSSLQSVGSMLSSGCDRFGKVPVVELSHLPHASRVPHRRPAHASRTGVPHTHPAHTSRTLRRAVAGALAPQAPHTCRATARRRSEVPTGGFLVMHRGPIPLWTNWLGILHRHGCNSVFSKGIHNKKAKPEP